MKESEQKVIHQYLDGELGEFMEEFLFDRLAADNELRQEFFEQITFHKTIEKDRASLSAPARSKDIVFSTLGIGEYEHYPRAAGARFFYLKYLISATLLSALFVAESGYTAISELQPVRDRIVQKQAVSTRDGSRSEPRRQAHTRSLERHMSGTGYMPVRRIATEGFPPDLQLSAVAGIEEVPIIGFSIPPPLERGKLLSFLPLHRIDDEPAALTAKTDFQLRQINIMSGAAVNAGNYALAAFYPIAAGQYIGVEAGSHHFALKTREKLNGDWTGVLRFDPRNYYGLGYRWEPDWPALTDGAGPFVQCMVGGAGNGVIGKFLAGLQYAPVNGVTIHIASENSALLYFPETRPDISSNSAVSFGITLRY